MILASVLKGFDTVSFRTGEGPVGCFCHKCININYSININKKGMRVEEKLQLGLKLGAPDA